MFFLTPSQSAQRSAFQEEGERKNHLGSNKGELNLDLFIRMLQSPGYEYWENYDLMVYIEFFIT